MQSRLSRRVLLTVFTLVLVIEGALLYGLTRQYEADNLHAVDERARTALTALILTHPYAMSDKMLLATVELLLPGTDITGGVLYSPSGARIGQFGEPPATTRLNTPPRRSLNGARYDLVWHANVTGMPFSVHARLNTTAVQLRVETFATRAIVAALGVAALITLGTALLIGSSVFVPFARLRQALGLPGDLADSTADEWRQLHDTATRHNAGQASPDPTGRIEPPIIEQRVEERTARLRAEIKRLSDSEAQLSKLATLTENAHTPILRCSTEGVLLYANEPARTLLTHWGAQVGEALPAPWSARISGFVQRAAAGEIEETFGAQTYLLSIAPTPDGQAVDIFGHDITARKRSEREQANAQPERARHDLLSGLNGPAAATERLSHALALYHSSNQGGALHMVEIVGMESAIGDPGATSELMRQALARLRTMAATLGDGEDAIVRIGRARFAVVQERLRNPTEAIVLAEHIIDTLAAPFHADNTVQDGPAHNTPTSNTRTIRLQSCVGITTFPEDGIDSAQLIRNADMALEHAQSEGPNSLRFFVARLNEQLQQRNSLMAELRQALSSNALSLHYQARLGLNACRITAAEALIRWPRGEQTLLPADFIALADSCDVGIALGRWTLMQACRQHAAWLASGFPLITVSVNVSVALARSGDLIGAVQAALQSSGLDAALLELELPEGLIMSDPQGFTPMFATLRDLGVRIALDSFGTGYSSMEHLSALPVDRIKIDQTFVSAIGKDARAAQTVRTSAALAHGLGVGVTAVGVETSDQVDFIQTLPVDEIQGFAFAEPMAPDAFHAFVDNFTEVTVSFPAGRTQSKA